MKPGKTVKFIGVIIIFILVVGAVFSLYQREDKMVVNPTETKKETNCGGIIIEKAPSDYATNPEKYETYLLEQSEHGENIVFLPENQVKNFKFFRLDRDEYITNHRLEISEVFYSADYLTNKKPFVVNIYEPGLGPSYGISYEDHSGDSKQFVILESGVDGSFFLEEVTENKTESASNTINSDSEITEISVESVVGISEEEAVQLCYQVMGERDSETGFAFSFGVSGAVEAEQQQFYVVRGSWLVENSHLSYIGDFFVSADGKTVYTGEALPGEYMINQKIFSE